MRHRVAGYKLSRTTAQRSNLRRSLLTDLVNHGRIQTTEAKCKAIRNQAEKLVTIAKGGLSEETAKQIHARRMVAAQLNGGVDVVRKVFTDIAPRYQARKGDNAPMALIEWV